MSLNSTTLSNIRATGKYYEIADRDGLSVRVSPNGGLTFQFRYRYMGSPRRMKLGGFPETGLKQARERLRSAREILDSGVDPITHEKSSRKRALQAPTLKILCQKWVTDYAVPRRQRWQDLDNMLKSDVYDQLGTVPVEKVTRLMITDEVLAPIVKRGAPVQANKTLTLLKQILGYGVELGYLEVNPASSISKRTIGGREVARSRVLSNDEIVLIWQGLDAADMTPRVGTAIKLLLVTGQRRGELTRARWEHIDIGKAIWHIPAEHAKNGKAHKVHLSAQALELFAELRKLRTSNEWVMPSATGEDRPMNENAISRAVSRNIKALGVRKWVPHDLRRTAATGMNSIGVLPHVVEKILNHSLIGVMAVYNHYDYWSEGVAAMNRWSDNVRKLLIDAQSKNFPQKVEDASCNYVICAE